MNTFLSLFLVVVGGILSGLFSLPITRTPRWKFEQTWFAGSLFALVVLPWPLVFFTVPDVGALYSSVPPGVLVAVILSGAAWGIGGIFWGRAIEALGVALGVSIMMTIITISGSLGPMAVFDASKLSTSGGLLLLVSLAVMALGVGLIAKAGSVRAAEQRPANPSAAEGPTQKSFSFGMGLLFAVTSGLLSAGVNFGFVFGSPVAEAATASGVPSFARGFAIWSLVFTANYAINAIYGLWMMVRNGNVQRLFADATPGCWLGALFMGFAWPGGIILYGIGAAGLGPFGAYVGFPMLLLVSILAGNAAGALTGEWRGTTAKPRWLMAGGIVVLGVAFVLLGFSNQLLSTR